VKTYIILNEWQLRREIIDAGKKAYDRGFVTATDGNISVRVVGDRFLITPSGCCLGELKAEHLVYIDFDGKVLSGGKPTGELSMHLAAYRERPDINAVLHAHPPITTGFTIAGESLAQCIIPEVVMIFGIIPTTEYATISTDEGAQVIKKLIKNHDAIILDRHGTITVGKNLLDAYRKLEKVEYCAQVTLAARQLGRVKTLSAEQIKKLDAVRRQYGYEWQASLCEQCGVCKT
jgi:L-fuculose-phosphate aldolase